MSITTNNETVVAAFHSPQEAQQAIHRLKKAGFTDEQIGVVSPGDVLPLLAGIQATRKPIVGSCRGAMR